MLTLTLPHALLAIHGPSDLRWLGQSADFQEDWRSPLEELCRGFGARPQGVRCPAAVFARPLSPKQVAVVQVADLGTDGDQPPSALGFHAIILSQAAYVGLGGDPFAVADACPVNWHQRGPLPSLTFTTQPQQRTVAQVCEVLKRDDGPSLLGAAQALVDGSRVAWVRPQPEGRLIRGLWLLLPTSTRTYLWPASFAFGNALRFHAVVIPQVHKPEFDHQYLSEEQAANYPEGAYELAVQSAAEAGDQAWLDSVLARRSRREVWRLGLWVLAGLVILTLLFNLLKLVIK